LAGKAEPQITKVDAKQRPSAAVPEVTFARRATQALHEHTAEEPAPPSLPSALVVGRADDPAEARASAAAARALGVAELRRHASGADRLGGAPVDPATASAIERARGGGAPLPRALSRDLSAGFGAPLDHVRVHTGGPADGLARRLDAEAFTVGTDIFFRGGAYDPGSDAGRETIAHEVAHTVHEGGGALRRFVSPKKFKDTTITNYHARGDAIEAIDALLKQYVTVEAEWAKLNAAPPAPAPGAAPPRPNTAAKRANLQRRIRMLDDMGDVAHMWLNAHTSKGDHSAVGTTYDPTSSDIDPKRKQRWEGVKFFLDYQTPALPDASRYRHPDNVRHNDPVRGARAEKAELDRQLTALAAPAPVPGAAPAATPERSKQFKKIQKKYDAELGSVFNSLAGVVEMLVPNRGDSAELEVEVRAPVDPNGIGFVGLNIKLELQHDALIGDVQGSEGKDNIVMRVEVAIVGGIQIPELLEVKGKLGVYLEVSADDATRATTLVSYGLYRRWRESVFMPDPICSYLWSGGRAGEFGYIKAEEWSKGVEKREFADRPDPKDPTKTIKNDAYVETGGLVGAGAKAGVKAGGIGFEVGGEAAFGAGRRYDQESILQSKGALGDANKVASDPTQEAGSGKGAQQVLGSDVMTFAAKAEFKVAPVSGELQGGGKWRRAAPTTDPATGAKTPGPYKLDSLEFQLVGKFTIPLVGHADSIAQHVIRKVAPALASLPGIVRKIVASMRGETQKEGWAWTGEVGNALIGTLPLISDFASAGPKDPMIGTMGDSTIVGANNTNIPKAVADSTRSSVAAEGVKFQQNLSGVLTLAIDNSANIQIELSTEKSVEVNVPLFLQAKAKTSSRIALIEIRGGSSGAAPGVAAPAAPAAPGAGAPPAGPGGTPPPTPPKKSRVRVR
jgi:hypothetical protein